MSLMRSTPVDGGIFSKIFARIFRTRLDVPNPSPPHHVRFPGRSPCPEKPMLQLNPPIPMNTPKGFAHLVIDYGPESDLYWTVLIMKRERSGPARTNMYARPETSRRGTPSRRCRRAKTRREVPILRWRGRVYRWSGKPERQAGYIATTPAGICAVSLTLP